MELICGSRGLLAGIDVINIAWTVLLHIVLSAHASSVHISCTCLDCFVAESSLELIEVSLPLRRVTSGTENQTL